MSCLIKLISTNSYIYWQDAAVELELDPVDLQNILFKFKEKPDKCSRAEKYFAQSLNKCESIVKNNLYKTASKSKFFAEKALALKDARYSLETKNQIRAQAICLIKAAKTVCFDTNNITCPPEEIYELIMREIIKNDKDSEIIEISNMLENF